MSAPSLHIVAACTDRKKQSAGTSLRFGDVTHASNLDRRATAWWRALQSQPTTARARDVYAGEHWVTVLEVEESAKRRWSPTLWVASAGYGLIRADQTIAAYSATFASHPRDQVTAGVPGRQADVRGQWWRTLSNLETDAPRSLAALAESDPESKIVVVASPAYVEAMTHDLRAVSDPARVVVFSSGAHTGPIEDVVVRVDARLLHHIGGSRIALNARCALNAVTSVPPKRFKASALREHYEQLAISAPELDTFPDREVRSDAEITRLVRRLLRTEPSIAATRALRRLRDEGHRCEQKRFRRLFDEAREASHAS